MFVAYRLLSAPRASLCTSLVFLKIHSMHSDAFFISLLMSPMIYRCYWFTHRFPLDHPLITHWQHIVIELLIFHSFLAFSFVVADVLVIKRGSHLWEKTINVSTRMFTVRVASLKKQDENWLNSWAYVFISPRCIRAFSCAFTVAYATVYLTSVNKGFEE